MRALAVVPIILFHAGFELFSGGFIGVDVFFVISGYLITSILIEDIQNGQFSIIHFYERRARRILPALLFMVLTCIIIGWFVLTPYFYRDLFQTILSLALFLSNVLFYMKSGYFSPISELKPLLHTWSLSVEEQFYVLFPLILLAIYKFAKQYLFIILLCICLTSFGMCIWLLDSDQSGSFYLSHTRAWELLLGAFVSILIKKHGIYSSNLFSMVGLLMVLVPIFILNAHTPFPGYYALLPTIGTMLIILFSDNFTLIGRLLATKFLVGIGLLSYSLYLWHQPMLAFIRHMSLREISTPQIIAAIGATFIASYFSWRFIEQPFRNKNQISRKVIFSGATLILFVMIASGYYGHVKLGFPSRLTESSQSIALGSFDKNPKQRDCFYLEKLSTIQDACVLGDNKNKSPQLALVGDSHADQLAWSLDRKLKKLGKSAYNLSFLHCKPLNFDENDITFTENICFEKILEFLKDHHSIEAIIVSFRWTAHLTDTTFSARYHGAPKSSSEPLPTKRGSALHSKLKDLLGGKRSLIVYPVPEVGEDVPNFTIKYRMLKDEDYEIEIPLNHFEERNNTTIQTLDKLAVDPEPERLYPNKLFCSGELNSCKTVINNRSLYYDDNHLSNYGAAIVVDQMYDFLSIK